MSLEKEISAFKSPEIYIEHPEVQENRPRVVQKNTADLLDFYFNVGGLPSYDSIKEYLRDYTVPYIRNIREGLRIVEDLAEHSGKHYIDSVLKRDQKLITIVNFGKKPLNNEFEAFDVALSTFWYMRDLYMNEKRPVRIPSHIEPPQTIREFRGRTLELFTLADDVIDGSLPPNSLRSLNDSKYRALMFFAIGGDMSTKR